MVPTEVLVLLTYLPQQWTLQPLTQIIHTRITSETTACRNFSALTNTQWLVAAPSQFKRLILSHLCLTLLQRDDRNYHISRIVTLPSSSSISFNELTVTVASYIDMNTGSVEFKTEWVVEPIQHVFHDSNLINIRAGSIVIFKRISVFVQLILLFCAAIRSHRFN